MGAEPRRITRAEVWTEWENQVVNGVFPLRRFLGRSNHSAVFLTECRAENRPDAAIKFVRADALQGDAQLVQWGVAAALSHPHLIRLFDVGRWQFAGRGFLFVVMEYAEQTLAQILPKRALSPDEARQMLLPTVDALAFLRRHQLVQGQLKPSNVLVVNDELKLASDTVRPIGNSPAGIHRTSLYDAPELKDGVVSTAGDVWSLGITLVEALTQHTPRWPEELSGTAALPAGFPGQFVDTVRRCLSSTPADRPTLSKLENQYNPAPPAHSISVRQPPARPTAREVTPAQTLPKRYLLPAAMAAALLISVAGWSVLRFFQEHPDSNPATYSTLQDSLQPPAAPSGAAPTMTAYAVPPPAVPSAAESAQSKSERSSPVFGPPDQPSRAPAPDSLSVLHEVSPDVSRVIQGKIRGHVKVTVRVLVDPTGDVVGEFLENPGPSKYFARLASDAAGGWKFVPADNRDPRVWLLRFDFTRSGARVNATAAQ
jgi:serine/threonine protein kinase